MEIDKWGLLDKLRLRIDTWGVALPPYAGLDEAIESLERRYKKHPSSWVIAYTLGDLYQQARRYADSIAVCLRCVELRPNDARSRYALGTAYRMPDLTIAQKERQCKKAPEPGLSLMTSRHKARYWFQQAAEAAGPRSRKFIAFHIQALEVQYRRLFGREMKPDFKRYLDVRHLSVNSAFLDCYVTERIDELELVQARTEE